MKDKETAESQKVSNDRIGIIQCEGAYIKSREQQVGLYSDRTFLCAAFRESPEGVNYCGNGLDGIRLINIVIAIRDGAPRVEVDFWGRRVVGGCLIAKQLRAKLENQ